MSEVKTIREALAERILQCDGGMGSLLQAAGLKAGELPETWNILHPEVITGIHLDYLNAGCDIINTNTFGANGLKFNGITEYDLPEIVGAAFACAKEAVRKAGHGYIALDLGPTGKLLRPMGELAFEDCVAFYADVVRLGVENGADLIFIETMSDLYELKAAVLAAKENSDLPVFATVVFDAKGRLLTGGTACAAAALLEGMGVDALGVNCGLGPVQMKMVVQELLACSSLPVIVNPNAGLPRTEGNRTVYDIGPAEFADAMEELLEEGISVAGGCCGTTPEHMRLLHERIVGRAKGVISKKEMTIVTSYAIAQEITDDPVLIGERINPTGKKMLQQALRERDMDYVLNMALAEQRQGAHILDVNVGLPGIDEEALLVQTVEEIQSIVELPLEIDSSDYAALGAAMRIYNGKPLVNSVNGKKESMDAIFPLVKKYGGVVVALLLDEDGIPDTSDGRLAVARKILDEAAKYGIGQKDILFDCLCMTISSDERAALVTLETIRRIRAELGGKTVIGLSNVSFGLPSRPVINGAFSSMALATGLNAVIMNPGSAPMMQSYYSFRALAGLDRNCADYIRYIESAPKVPDPGGAGAPKVPDPGGASAPKVPDPGGASAPKVPDPRGADPAVQLMNAVEKGLKEQSVRLVKTLLEQQEAMAVINGSMIPALDHAGKAFEKGKMYLPQLLMCADAAKAAFGVIKEQMAGSGVTNMKKDRIILATVKGDIHDIGKNIVRVLLENYSYEVIDLGRDVPPEVIVETVLKEKVRMVGLSALMTTTVASMAETIAQLRAAAPDVKIAVGGAVLTKEYAEEIGADRYCADAMATVNFAQEVFGKSTKSELE